MEVAALALAIALHLAIVFAPLVGWNFDLGVNAVAFGTFAVSATLLLLADSQRRREFPATSPQPLDARAHRLARVTGIALLVLEWSAVIECRRADELVPLAQIALGAGLLLSGVACRAAAVRQLGARFVSDAIPASVDHFEQTGIYAYVRHPSETGLLLAGLGIVVLLAAPLAALAGLPVLCLLSWRRVRLEEAALRATFGAAYDDYGTRVGAYFPKLVR